MPYTRAARSPKPGALALACLALSVMLVPLLATQQQAQEQQTAQQQAQAAPPPPPPQAPINMTPPSFCSAKPLKGFSHATTMVRGSPSFKIYRNLWFHNGKYFALVDSSVNDSAIEAGLSVNVGVINLPVTNLTQFVQNLRTCHLPGNTLMVDFPFPAFPDNLGHMAEVMLPTYSVLRQGLWHSSSLDGSQLLHRLMLANLQKPLSDWFKEVLAIAISPAVLQPGQLPTTIEKREVEQFEKLGWLHFENVLVIQDRYTHPQRLSGFMAPDHGDMWRHAEGCARFVSSNYTIGFFDPELAHEFVSMAYEKVNWPMPGAWQPGQPPALPKYITYMRYPEGNPAVVNEPELMDMLHEVADSLPGWRARTVSLTMEAPFLSHLATAAESGVLVARHGPILANAVFLPPGAVVMELLPYKWEWQQISKLYYNTTQSMGYLHHYAWRPKNESFCAYVEAGDERYAPWTYEECSSRECLVVHAKAGLKVDVAAVREILMDRLPQVLAGKQVEELRLDWPAT